MARLYNSPSASRSDYPTLYEGPRLLVCEKSAIRPLRHVIKIGLCGISSAETDSGELISRVCHPKITESPSDDL